MQSNYGFRRLTGLSSQRVIMSPNMPSFTGASEIKKVYDTFFANIKISVKFKVLEVDIVASEWAFASSTSAGTTVVHGRENRESNHELFVMQKMKGIWKVARYCFSAMNPPK
jgi:ketosteroid isomerase-like protein